jgi:hypothetical protein
LFLGGIKVWGAEIRMEMAKGREERKIQGRERGRGEKSEGNGMGWWKSLKSHKKGHYRYASLLACVLLVLLCWFSIVLGALVLLIHSASVN